MSRAVVTGGSAEVGRAVVEAFAREGCDMTGEPKREGAPTVTCPSRHQATGKRVGASATARDASWEMFTSRHKIALLAGSAMAGGPGLRSRLRARSSASHTVARR